MPLTNRHCYLELVLLGIGPEGGQGAVPRKAQLSAEAPQRATQRGMYRLILTPCVLNILGEQDRKMILQEIMSRP